MPGNRVIFSDGVETDFLRFTAGIEVVVSISLVWDYWSIEKRNRNEYPYAH